MRCPYCNRKMKGDAPDEKMWFNCDHCGERFIFEDGELTNVRDRNKKNRGHICYNCGKSLAGAVFTAPWADGDNESAYAICPHCGRKNYL